MKRFRRYVDDLEAFASRLLLAPDCAADERIAAVLGDEPAEQLRELVGIGRRREMGAFFTSALLRRKLLSPVDLSSAVALDPACGAGDLLLAFADNLPVYATVEQTVHSWGRQLHGADTNPDFVRAARARLTIAAVRRVRAVRTTMPRTRRGSRTFPFLRAQDGLSSLTSASRYTHIILNPPYSSRSAPHGCTWADGSVSRAAIFAARAVEHARPGATVLALLPDALRTGPRYARWRHHIQAFGAVVSSEPLGQFDEWTDIDVFALKFLAGRRTTSHAWQRVTTGSAVGDRCTVHVGDVVPHRHPARGPYRRYATTETLPRLGIVSSDDLPHRRFEGRVFSPPFVTVRRTSRPEDTPRLVPTVVTGNAPVALENHLVVLLPEERTQSACYRLIEVLIAAASTAWLRRHNRCRHVTAHVIRDLPWP